MSAKPIGYGGKKLVPKKGLEPPLSYREADFKLQIPNPTAVDKYCFLPVNTWLGQHLYRIFRPISGRVGNFVGRKESQIRDLSNSEPWTRMPSLVQ